MSNNNYFIKQFRESAGIRLAVLFGSFFILLLLASIINSIIDSSTIGSSRTHLLWGAVVQCVLVFCVPALILAKFSSTDWDGWLELNKVPQIRALFGVVIVYLLSMPAMEWLIEWNENLHFPSALSSLENVFRQWERAGEESTKIILNSEGWLSVSAGVLVIGILTGFSEELFFRGGLQGILQRSSFHKSLAVWIAAIIFSSMHFQFFGFLPRLLMGAFFGYLLVWTRSIWVPVFAHILNNSIVVITAPFTEDMSKGLIETTGTSNYLGSNFTVFSSVILTTLFFIFFRNSIFKFNNRNNFSWQKKQLHRISES